MELAKFMEKLSKPAQRAIFNSGITTLEGLAALSEKTVAQWHGIGPNALNSLRAILAENGLSFSDEPVRDKTSKRLRMSKLKNA